MSVNKRKSENNSSYNKRTKIGPFILKQLIPEVVAGALIGYKGETMMKLHKENPAYLKLSNTGDHFPGTNHRVLVISGEVDNVYNVHKLVWQLLTERPWSFKPMEMSLVITNLMAGVLIGRNASFMKSLQEQTDCKFRMSSRTNTHRLSERVITFYCLDTKKEESELNQLMKAFDIIFTAMRGEEDCTANSNDSYISASAQYPIDRHEGFPPPQPTQYNQNFQRSQLRRSHHFSEFAESDSAEMVTLMLRGAGYEESSIEEIVNAFLVLIKYQILPGVNAQSPVTFERIMSIIESSFMIKTVKRSLPH